MELGDKQRLHIVKLQKLYKLNRKLYWAKRDHRNTKGERMLFKNALFLVPIYYALSSKQRVCVIKSVQCFPAGTRIHTDTGYKEIQDIRVGDKVFTYRGRFKKVIKTFKKEYSGDLLRVISSNELFEENLDVLVTPEHPFMKLNTFEPIDDYVIGDGVIGFNNNEDLFYEYTLQHKERIKFEGSVYNFSVEEDESYIANGYVVHNCGLSEAVIISHLEEASRGLSILYVLPKTESRNTFVQNRINKVVQRVPYYRNMMQQSNVKSRVDSVILKNFGRGTIKYVDSNSESNFVEYPCDAVYLDEKDLMNQKNIEKAPDRFERSKYKLQRHLANPSVEDFGIHADWQESTQGIYNTKCPHCGEWQPYDWFVNVVREVGERQYEAVDTEWAKGNVKEARAYCRKCWKPIKRFAPGEYVHKYKIKEWHGFHVNKIFGSPYTTLSSIIRKFFRALRNDTKLQIFFNSDLGLPYASSQSKIGETELNACKLSKYYEPKENSTGFTFAGIDVGTFYHMIIRKLAVVDGEERKILLFCGKVRKKEEVIKKLKQYGVKSAVIDALPETHEVETLQDELKYLYKCFWSKSGKDPKLDKNNKTVTYDRTSIFDDVKEHVDYKQYANYTNMDSHPEYYIHMKSNTRVYDVESNRFVWVQSNKDDHLCLAEAYCLLACKLKLSSNVFEFYEKIHDEYKDAKQTTKGKTHTEVVNNILDNFYGKNRKK